VALFRSLKKTAIVLMVLFRLDKPVGEGEIAGILEMDRGTIRIYLRSSARIFLRFALLNYFLHSSAE
jgi:hypothetical protein